MFFDDEPHGVFFLIDNKSFYASCEAVARGLNPLKVPLVVLRTCLDTLTFDLILVKLDQKQEFLIHEKLCTPL
ncbi:hypothetical protein AB3327_16045 (plasmid) [Lactiplantibacillus pentosus]